MRNLAKFSLGDMKGKRDLKGADHKHLVYSHQVSQDAGFIFNS
jgi:hypothetical protein